MPLPPDLAALSADRPVALFLDFDGTLVDLAPTPDSISVPDGMARRLHQLSIQLNDRLALVSGRAILDLEKHLGPISVAVSGSHGGDCRRADGEPIGKVPAGLPSGALADIAAFAEERGFSLEDKPHGAALHYRPDPSLEDEGVKFATALASAHGLDVKRGKCVIELVGHGANKGAALRRFMQIAPFSDGIPVFVGDDITDEDGMRAACEFGGFGVLVGDRQPTCAKYGLATPAAVHHWLGL